MSVLTVEELIEKLKMQNPKAPVAVLVDSHEALLSVYSLHPGFWNEEGTFYQNKEDEKDLTPVVMLS